MNLDSLLGRIKVNGRPMSRLRLTWWLVIGLTRLFGREVEIEGAGGKKLRILPVVWNKKVHLLGAEHETLRVDFSWPYTTRLHRVPEVTVTAGQARPITGKSDGGKIVHVILCHVAPRTTERILRHAQGLGPDYHILLAYGGTKENFDLVDWPNKIFLDDPTLRGPAYLMSYLQLSDCFRAYAKQAGITAQWIFIGDYDLLPLKPDYLGGLVGLMTANEAALGGKMIREVSLSNLLFLTQAIENGRIDDSLNGAARAAVYHCLGSGLLFSGECLDTIFEGEENLSQALFELSVLTSAGKKGFRLLSFDKFGDEFKYVNFRPVYSADEALKIAATGAPFVHPVKNVDQFLDGWKLPATVVT